MVKRLVCKWCSKDKLVKVNTKEFHQIAFEWQQQHKDCRIPHFIYKVTVSAKGGDTHVNTN